MTRAQKSKLMKAQIVKNPISVYWTPFQNWIWFFVWKEIDIEFQTCFFSSRVTDSNQKENLGILVQYKVKVKLFLGSLGG